MCQKDTRKNYITSAIFMSLAILLLTLICLIWIARHSSVNSANTENRTADIYQNGILLKSVPLTAGQEPYSFTITGENGCFNKITVGDGCIGISSASCPDKLCVHQGYINTSLLPITCLPNKLVIQVRENDSDSFIEENSSGLDIMAY